MAITQSTNSSKAPSSSAPAYSPSKGIGATSGGYTFTTSGWKPTAQSNVKMSSQGGLMSVVPKSKPNQSIVPRSSIQTTQTYQSKVPTSSIRSYSGGSGSSSSQTQSKVNLQTPTILQSKVPYISAPRTTLTNSLNSSGLYTPQVTGTKTITPTDITSPIVDIPTTEQDTTDYTSIISGLATTNPDGTPKVAPVAEKNALQQYMEEFNKLQQPDTGAIYNDAVNQSGLMGAKQQVNNLTEQLNTITSRAQAQQLSLTGQGRGIPEAIIGGQQAQIGREAAIAALPISAQLQAAQGNVEIAQQNMETLFKIRSSEAERTYSNNLKMLDAAYQYADGKEKEVLAQKAKQEEREYQKSLKVDGYTKDYMDIISSMIKEGKVSSRNGFQAMGDLINGGGKASEIMSRLGVLGSNNPGIVAGYNISSYATDPKHEMKVAAIYSALDNVTNPKDLQEVINTNYPKSPITAQMIMNSSNTFNVDPKMVFAIMAQDSSLGTAGMGARNNNPGNIGQFDNLGKPVAGYKNMQEGVNAVAKWLSNKKATGIYNGEFAATIENAGEFTTDKNRGAFKESLKGFIGSKDYKSAYSKIQSVVSNALTGDNKTQFDSKVSALPAIDELTTKLQAYQAAGGDTGLLKGTYEKVYNKLGAVKDPAFKTLATDLRISLQKYRKDLSGAAFSAQEAKDYESVNPSGSNKLNLNLSILQGMRDNFERQVTSAVDSRLEGAQYIREYSQYQGLKPVQILSKFSSRSEEMRAYIERERQLGTTPDVVLEALGYGALISS